MSDTYHRLGKLFRPRKEKGRAGLPVLSVTKNGGLSENGTLDKATNRSSPIPFSIANRFRKEARYGT